LTLTLTLSDGGEIEISDGKLPILIEYGGKKYRLILTKNGKLILN